MEVAGYIASLAIGISLGLIGGGGSILTVPVLVYLFRVQPVVATAYSLFIVGTTSLVGSIPKYRDRQINLKTAVIFGFPSLAAVYATRAFVIPAIPMDLFVIGNLTVTKSLLMMVLFAVLMVFASIALITDKKPSKEALEAKKLNYPLILAEGMAVGMLTGFVGAGGGFLIIPALVFLTRLPMKQAVGTSLVIIAANSLVGFSGNPGKAGMDWPLLLTLTGLATVGLFIGNGVSKRISADRLKKGLGWFVLVMGIYIIIQELAFSSTQVIK